MAATATDSAEKVETGLVVPSESDSTLRVVELAHDNQHTPKRGKARQTTIVLTLQLSLFVTALNTTIVATALPSIVDDLKSPDGYSWIASAYLLASTAAAPIWIKASDIWGRKPILLGTIAWFAMGSTVCATAKTMPWLIAGRALQGTAGGALAQMTMVVVCDLWSPRQRSLFFASLQVVWAFASGVGPVIGGALAQTVGWPWIFWLNLPIAAVAFVLLLLTLDVHNPRTSVRDGAKAVDWLGALSIVGLTAMLLVGLDFGGKIYPWGSAKVVCLLVFGAAMIVPFVFAEKKVARYPLMPMRLFRDRSNAAAIAVSAAAFFLIIAIEYFLPLFFQSVYQASPLQSGLYILPHMLTASAAAVLGGFFINKTGRYRGLIIAGSAVMTLGGGLFILISDTTSLALDLGVQVICAVGIGLLLDAPIIALQANVRQEDVATAISANGFIKYVAMAVAAVVSGAVFENVMKLQCGALQRAGLSSALAQSFCSGGASSQVETVALIHNTVQQDAVRAAYAYGLKYVWIVMTGVAGAGLILSLLIKEVPLSETHTETQTGLKGEESG